MTKRASPTTLHLLEKSFILIIKYLLLNTVASFCFVREKTSVLKNKPIFREITQVIALGYLCAHDTAFHRIFSTRFCNV